MIGNMKKKRKKTNKQNRIKEKKTRIKYETYNKKKTVCVL